MVLLLVVGLAAVILVILIAVFLSVRLGRSDDSEEPAGGPSERGRGRLDTDDTRWRDERSRSQRRPPAPAARPARSGQRPPPEAQDRRYRDRGDRRPERDQAARSRDYDSSQRRSGRYDTGPVEQLTDPRRPVAAGARRSGSGRDNGGRRAGTGRDRHEAEPGLYDTGPAPRPAAGDFPSEPLHAADFPSGEFPSMPLPAADFPSGEFPSASQPAADAPTARYRAAVPRSNEFPSGPLPAADFASGEFPAADFPSEEMPAARTRGRSAPPKDGPGRDRPDSHRRAAKGQSTPKGRSRKRDDDDWPSMEWDKLTDEQYWAELSSDKPLATTARSPQPSSEPKPAAAKNGHARPAAAKNGRARPAAAQPSASAPQPAPPAAGRARARSPRDPAAVNPQRAVAQREAVTERLPIRPRQRPEAAAQPRNDAPPPIRPDATATQPGGEPSLAMLASLASRPAGALDDDPLTSPSFSRPALDSRSYGSARNSTRPIDTDPGARAGGPAAAGYGSGAHHAADYGDTGYAGGDYPNGGYANGEPNDPTPVNGTYQVPEYADPDYAYTPAAQAAPADATQPTDWYSAPTHAPAQGNTHTPAQSNPYGSYVEQAPAASYPSTPPMGYQDQHAGAGIPAYPGDQGGYQQPAYDQVAAHPYAGPPANGVPVQPSGNGQFQQHAAYQEPGYAEDGRYGSEYPGQAPYADSNGTAGYTDGYPAASYAADQYGQDDYGGYPAGQG